MILTATFKPCEEGGYYATIAEIRGVHSQGETLAEAIDNLADALAQTFAYKVQAGLAQVGESSEKIKVELPS
jgi:predicted RNase H-like HicB family nuclease